MMSMKLGAISAGASNIKSRVSSKAEEAKVGEKASAVGKKISAGASNIKNKVSVKAEEAKVGEKA